MKFGTETMGKNDPSKEINENIITGKELKGKLMAGIGTSDISIYEKYLKEKELNIRFILIKKVQNSLC